MPESLAYFSTLALFARSPPRAAGDRRRWTIATIALALVLSRSRTAVRGAAAVVVARGSARRAGLRRDERARIRSTIVAWTTRPARRRCSCSALGLVIAADVVVAHHSYEWFDRHQHFRHRMFTYGLWAGSAPHDRSRHPAGDRSRSPGLSAARSRRARTALACLRRCSSASILTFGLYTAVKASYLSTIFAIRVEERNLIYLSPLDPDRRDHAPCCRCASASCRSRSPRPRPATCSGRRLPRLRAPLLRRVRPLDPADG